ncbi:hypothetical protein Ahy_B08g092734 [Arachis hypogaea]|uniref:Uncharacterized protein n=1 Tax=Arachis hypogaea TaxID=3818 RepID=A0A444Y4J2_ARAHY|nr:hypothetical protein Ahy_B08g092734 [Arachis hypogaea]
MSSSKPPTAATTGETRTATDAVRPSLPSFLLLFSSSPLFNPHPDPHCRASAAPPSATARIVAATITRRRHCLPPFFHFPAPFSSTLFQPTINEQPNEPRPEVGGENVESVTKPPPHPRSKKRKVDSTNVGATLGETPTNPAPSTVETDEENGKDDPNEETIKSLVEANPSIKVKSVITKMQLKFNYTISYRKAWLAKQKTVEKIFGGWEASSEALCCKSSC